MGLNDLGNLGLGFSFSAQDAASGVVRGLNGNVQNLKSSGEQAGASMMTAFSQIARGTAMVTAGMAGMAAVYLPAVQAEQRMTDVLVRYGTTAAALPGQLETLRVATEGMRREMRASETDISAAFTVLAGKKIAVGSDTMKDFARAGLMVAAVMGTDIATATDAASEASEIFHLRAADSVRSMSQLTEAAKRSDMNFSELAMAVARSGKEIGAMRLDLPGFSALMIGLADNGYRGRAMMSGLQQAMQALTDTTAPFAKGLWSMGITMKDATGNIRPASAIIADLQRKIVGLDDTAALAKFRKAFGQQAPLALALARTNFEGLRGEVSKFNGLADSYNAKMETAESKTKNLGSATLALSQTVGGPLLKAFKEGTDWLTKWVNAARDYLEVSPELNAVIGNTVLALSGIGVAAGSIVTVGGVWGFMTSGVGGLTAGFGWLATAAGSVAMHLGAIFGVTTIGAIGTITAGILGLVAGMATYAYFWDEIPVTVKKVVTVLALLNPLTWGFAQIGILKTIINRWEQMGEGFTGVVNTIIMVAREAGALIFEALSWPYKKILQLIGMIPGTIGSYGRIGADTLTAMAGGIRGQGPAFNPAIGIGGYIQAGVRGAEAASGAMAGGVSGYVSGAGQVQNPFAPAASPMMATGAGATMQMPQGMAEAIAQAVKDGASNLKVQSTVQVQMDKRTIAESVSEGQAENAELEHRGSFGVY